jgi:hypothetical protein
MFKKLWCYLRNHPYDWVMDPEDAADYVAGNYRPNIAPSSHCSNCGCTSR